MILNSVKIKIYKSVEQRIKGKPVQVQELFHSCWADLLQLYGKELYEAINIKLENTLIFKIRYCKKLKELMNKECYTVEFDGHIYKIYYSDFTKYFNKHVLLKCNLIK